MSFVVRFKLYSYLAESTSSIGGSIVSFFLILKEFNSL